MVAMDSGAELNYRQVLLELAADRPAGDLLFAPARPGDRQSRVSTESASLYRHLAQTTELAFVAKGEARIATPDEVFRMTGRKLLVIERGVYHAQLPAVSISGHQVIWVHLNRSSANLVDSVYSPSGAARFCYTAIELSGRTNVESIGTAIASELGGKQWAYQAAVAGLLRYLSCILVRRLPRARVSAPRLQESSLIGGDARTWSALEAALDFCDANFHLGITRTDVANAVGYSPRHLSQLTATYLGHSLSDHLRNLRIAEARRLLESSRLTIHGIADAVGYTDPAHFARAFKQATGLSPRTYRRRLGVL